MLVTILFLTFIYGNTINGNEIDENMADMNEIDEYMIDRNEIDENMVVGSRANGNITDGNIIDGNIIDRNIVVESTVNEYEIAKNNINEYEIAKNDMCENVIDEIVFNNGKIILVTHSKNNPPVKRILAVLDSSDPTKIEKLDLSCRNLERIPVNFVEMFPNLRSLNLSENLIRQVHGIDSLKNLEVLDLSYNRLDGLSFYRFNSSIKELYLNDNKLRTIFRDAFKGLRNLEVLNLSNTEIDDLPPSFEDLVSLNSLSLDSNRIGVFPVDVLGNFKNLEHLFLSRNKLVFIPPTISNLAQLKTLKLNENNLSYLPVSIKKLKLSYLGLYGNENFNENTLFPTQLGKDKLRGMFNGSVYFSTEEETT